LGTEHKKWVHEIILEKVPPFSWVPRGYNVALQLLLMEIVGLSVAAMFSLSTRSMFYGSLAILVIWIWSLLAFYIASTVHRLKPPSAPSERDVINEYQESLFSPRHRELGFSFLILAFILLYLFLERNLVVHWLDGNLSPILLLLVAILLWDISYRLGLGLWSAVTALRRSVSLSRVSRSRSKMRYTAYEELRTLRRLDLINLSFGAVTLLFYPLASIDLVFFAGLLVYSAGISLFSAISFIIVGRIPGFPQEIIWLLTEGKFGYVGTSDKKMTPHLTPVIFVFDGHRIFFVVSKISKKLRNIRENEKIAFLVDVRDQNNLYNNRAVLFMGKAKVYGLFDAALNIVRLLKVRSIFYKKYPEYVYKYKTEEESLPLAWRTTLFVSRMLVEIEVEKMVYWRQARPIRLPLRG
jgi:nitroimidazol reductase NimA-like FMN-containing flavoprotein (pyridoxamine 5'-phosphate oxidase superfamily)